MTLVTDLNELAALRTGLDPAHLAGVDVDLLLGQAAAAFEREDLTTAEPLLQAALVVDPDRPATWALTGRLADQAGDITAARAAYRRAISLTEDFESTMSLAELQAATGENNEASALANYLLLHCPDPELVSVARALLTRINPVQP